jgi:hypothetical protein
MNNGHEKYNNPLSQLFRQTDVLTDAASYVTTWYICCLTVCGPIMKPVTAPIKMR